MHERYRRQTDGWAIAYSEREREFTFVKKAIIGFVQRFVVAENKEKIANYNIQSQI